MRIAIFASSQMIAQIESDDYPSLKRAWKSARFIVRTYAHNDGVTGLNDGWYRTANRVGYACGIYRATPVVADR